MTNEAETESHNDVMVHIGEREVNLEEIFKSGKPSDIEVKGDPVRHILIDVKERVVDIRPLDTKEFFFRAEVSPSGDLSINMVLKLKDGRRDPALPHGKELVEAAIGYLEDHTEIRRLAAMWQEGSDNFSQFLTNSNGRKMRNADAAKDTWTGKNIAEKYGFTYLEDRDVYKDMHSDERFISAKFSRAPRDA